MGWTLGRPILAQVSDNEHGDIVSITYSNAPQSTPAVTYGYDRRVVEKILRHLGAWHDPPPRPPPPEGSGPYTYEPCREVDPMPDYENVLTG
ncbi:MAG: hypothetical protein DME25_08485 [Verrucomicrobia bacterium]|nr:MAG: hypothetical protein DME25_08485 [Verrucomicrobiota bacterium]